MNFLATIEHSLNYKYKGDFPDDQKRLETTANLAYLLMKRWGQSGCDSGGSSPV